MVFRRIEGEVWIPSEEDEEITGVLTDIEDGEYDKKNYTLEVKQKPRKIYGTTILDDLMKDVTIGSLVKIVYKGIKEGKKGRNATKLFEVYVDVPE